MNHDERLEVLCQINQYVIVGIEWENADTNCDIKE